MGVIDHACRGIPLENQRAVPLLGGWVESTADGDAKGGTAGVAVGRGAAAETGGGRNNGPFCPHPEAISAAASRTMPLPTVGRENKPPRMGFFNIVMAL